MSDVFSIVSYSNLVFPHAEISVWQKEYQGGGVRAEVQANFYGWTLESTILQFKLHEVDGNNWLLGVYGDGIIAPALNTDQHTQTIFASISTFSLEGRLDISDRFCVGNFIFAGTSITTSRSYLGTYQDGNGMEKFYWSFEILGKSPGLSVSIPEPTAILALFLLIVLALIRKGRRKRLG